MCTVTVILPQNYPEIEDSQYIRPLAEPVLAQQTDCFLADEELVWHNNGLYFLFSCQPRQLVLNAVSDFNPLIGLQPQPLDRALKEVAMEEVDRLVVKHRKYRVRTNTGNLLRKELRRNLHTAFQCSHIAVKNYFGPIHHKLVNQHYRQLIDLAEAALIKPAKLVMVAWLPGNDCRRSLLLIDEQGASFKCVLSDTKLRITHAAPAGNFSIHRFRNQDIKITQHCLERFAARVLERDLNAINPLLTQGELLKFIKNRTISHACQMGRMVFVNVSGYIFIGAVSRGKLSLVTTYRETLVEPEEFHQQILSLFQTANPETALAPA
ncbi:MAG: hypothetical protein ACOX2G_04165 [Bacillota bacterium]